MRQILVLYILACLYVLPAESRLSLAMVPQERKYVLSLAQQNPTSTWDGQLSFSFPDALHLALPLRFRIGMKDVSVSLGYAGFWQEYALLPSVASRQALLYTAENDAFALFMGKNQSFIGYEHATKRGEFSALAWMQQRKELSSFQSVWGPDHAGWGIIGKALIRSNHFGLHAELLFTPVQGMEIFVSSSYKFGPTEIGIAYGEAPYPTRYKLALTLQSRSVKASFMLEDWFGPKPIYGGFSVMRRRRQSSDLKISQGTGYLLFTLTDTYDFTSRGSEGGSVVVKCRWVGPFGQISAQYGSSRGPTSPKECQYKLSLVLFKATLSYTAQGYEITLSDSVVMGRGIGTWKLKKSMGASLSLALVYTITSVL